MSIWAQRRPHQHHHNMTWTSCPLMHTIIYLAKSKVLQQNQVDIKINQMFAVYLYSTRAACVISAIRLLCSQHHLVWQVSFILSASFDLQSWCWKQSFILREKQIHNPSLYWCSFVTQLQALTVAERQPREGGATCRGSAHSSRVSTLFVFHCIFKSKDR